MSRLSELYRELTREYVRGLGCEVPERYQSSFVAWGGSADVQHIYSRWAGHLSHSAKVLVVGVVGGRDFFLMRSLGFDVIGVDVAEHPEIDPVVTANIEDELPFEENEFDLVIVSEVLEHLRRDVDALEHIARVLKPNGKLIVSLPYYNDHAEGHVRVHSPLSAERLLKMGGFKIDDQVERPGLMRPGFLNPLQHGLCFLAWTLMRRTTYAWSNRLIGSIEWSLGHRSNLRRLRKLSKGFGAYFLCSSDAGADVAEPNKSIDSVDAQPSLVRTADEPRQPAA